MSNTRHAKAPGSVPPMPALPPPMAQHNLAQVIGQSVAYEVAALLGPILQRIVDQRERHACLVCAAKAKRAERAWEVDRENALRAAEPEPAKPDVRVSESFTDGARGPVCWACYDPELDGPFDMHAMLGDPVD